MLYALPSPHVVFARQTVLHPTDVYKRQGAAFIQRRYGWKWGIPAYAIASYVGWSRTYAKKHDWWDVVAGAALGAGSAYIFTRPFATKHNLSISPVASDKHFGIYAVSYTHLDVYKRQRFERSRC